MPFKENIHYFFSLKHFHTLLTFWKICIVHTLHQTLVDILESMIRLFWRTLRHWRDWIWDASPAGEESNASIGLRWLADDVISKWQTPSPEITIDYFQDISKINIRFVTTVKPVFKGHLYIREKVSLHDRCPFVTGSLTWGEIGHRFKKVSPDHRVSPRHSVPWRQVLLYLNHCFFCVY